MTAEPEEPAVEYYLIGYINGADYGCNDDSANLGEYKFVDGKLTAKFDVDSYVFVKTGDNAGWFMSEGFAAEPPATLYNTSIGLTDANKLFVPGGVEVEFTLTENEDGTLTLSAALLQARGLGQHHQCLSVGHRRRSRLRGLQRLARQGSFRQYPASRLV